MKDATQFHIRPARPEEAGLFYAQHPAEDERLGVMASFMGASKTALSIRMTQLGLLKRNDLSDPYSLVRVDMDEEDRIL